MRQKILPAVFLVVIALAVYGLIANLIHNPTQLISSLLIIVGITFLIFFAIKFFMQKKGNPQHNDEMKKYNSAVKQSQRRYQSSSTRTPRQVNGFTKLRKNKRRNHLTVIEGNKTNKK